MRIAVSGSHSTGKSTLIAAFLERCPRYAHEPEAYEMLADDISMTPFEGPDSEGLSALIELTISSLTSYAPGTCVIFERSPVDYLAYAAAAESFSDVEKEQLFEGQAPGVRQALRYLDCIVLLPVSSRGVAGRAGEDEGYRRRVDEELRRALIDDEYDLFEGPEAPKVMELSPLPDQQLAELLRGL